MLEESRSSLTGRLARQYAVPAHELTLSKLVSLLEEPYRSALEDARSKLVSLLRSIQEVNHHNCVLVRDSLHYAQQSLNVLYRSSSPNPTYLVDGSMKGPLRCGGLLSKEI
jgi:flagellar biosynthesis/type III secretory pathway chaperone